MIDYISVLLSRYPSLSVCEKDIRLASELIKTCYEHGGKLLIAGNGGSAADSDHICGELLKSFVKIDYQAKTQLQHNHSRHTAQITALSALSFRPPYSVYPFRFNKT